MRIRQTCAYILMAGGILLFADGATQAGQSKSGSESQADSTMGSQPGNTGGSMKQGHVPKGSTGQVPSKPSTKQGIKDADKERENPSDSPRCFGPPPSGSKDESPATLKKDQPS